MAEGASTASPLAPSNRPRLTLQAAVSIPQRGIRIERREHGLSVLGRKRAYHQQIVVESRQLLIPRPHADRHPRTLQIHVHTPARSFTPPQEPLELLRFLADNSRREFLISSRHEFLISSLIAGCSSGALSSVLCAPLVRTRLQVSGPGRGLLPALRDATSDGFLGQALYNLSSPPTHQT